MALTPLSPSSLNTKMAASPSLNLKSFLTMAESKAESPSPSKQVADEINWDEDPSSLFVTEVVPEQGTVHKSPSRDLVNMTLDLSPSKQLKMESAPFDICEDETSMPQEEPTPRPSPSKKDSTMTLAIEDETELFDNTGIDDTCYSTFSEVPNMDMTKFARLGNNSPSKFSVIDQTPRVSSRTLPSATPTPRASANQENDTTNLLIDFTQQFEAISTFSQRLSSISSRRSPNKSGPLAHLQSQRSPRKSPSTPLKNNNNILNLLDFELPPAPTPRSQPTISVRELESLKSSYASQISSLNATLSGREAEVSALKKAVSDAERRVGEASENAREEKTRRECVEKEKEEWEHRGREMEGVLKQVRAEVLENEKEKTDLVNRVDEAEDRVRELERKLADAENRLLQADAASNVSSEPAASSSSGPLFTAEQVQKQIDEKIHTLSTELHAIYKKKHVTKVAGLKKGFETKTAQKTAELQARVDDLEKQNDDLQSKLDSTFSGTILPATSEDRAKLDEQAATIENQKATIAGRDEELRARSAAYQQVLSELERERVEKGELVAAVDEMLSLQADMSVLNAAGESQGTVEDVLRKSVHGAAAAARGAMTPASGLRGPGFGFGGGPPSRIGAPSSGLARPAAGKSRMMSNIERMGARGAE